MLEFGNFRARPTGIIRNAVIFDKGTRTFRFLEIEGNPLSFCDAGEIVDTPRFPTNYWLNWAVAKANKIASQIKGDPNGNSMLVHARIDDSKPEIFIVFEDSNRPTSYTIQIMDFILRYTYTSGESQLINSIETFFKEQQPIS